MNKLAFFLGVAVIAASAGAVMAQPPAPRPPAAQPATAADPERVVGEVRRILAANYVLADVRPKLDAALAAGLASGRYSVSDPAALSDRINADLAAVAHDKHLSIHYSPDQAALVGARHSDERDDGEILARMAQVRNYGITEMKMLPGNVRYVAIDGFVWTGPKTAEAYDVAMRFLAGGDALIIDLRKNGGGSPAAVQYLVSHFLEANKPIVTFYMGANHVDRLSSLADLPAGRLTGKPLYVLVSGHTASAAEEFAGHVHGFKLGELIGANTAGAGFRNDLFAVPGGYVLSVSVGRAVLASTGADWEGKGIPASTVVDPDKALDVAELHAMRRLAGSASPREKRLYEGMATLLAAKVEPVATALPLGAYAGRFGERLVSLDQGKLMFQRDGGPRMEMVPLGPNRFAFDGDPDTRIDFAVAGGAATGFDMLRGDGSRVSATRTQ